MPSTYKPLGQKLPAAGVEVDLYVVPGATSTIASSVFVCNTGSATTFRVRHAWLAAATDPKQALYHDLPIGPNDTFIFTVGETLVATDALRVSSASGNVAFNAYGVEIT